MKKVLTVFLPIVLFLMNFTACIGSLSPERVLVYGFCDCFGAPKTQIEYRFADEKAYEDKTVAEEAEITIDGKRYVGHFQSTQYREVNYFPVYRYADENGFDFEIDDQGRLISAFWGGEVEAHQKALSMEECKQIATDFMKEIVDLSAYTVTVTEEPEDRQYEVLFQKYIADFETSDQATVVVNMDGKLYSYSSFMLGRVPLGDDRIQKVDSAEVETAVQEKLDTLYGDRKCEYETISMTLTVLKDGTWAFLYTVDVHEEGITVGEVTLPHSHRIWLMVELK